MPNRTLLRKYFKSFFNSYMSHFAKENRTDPFLINMGLNYYKRIFLEDWILNKNKKEDFEDFFKNVFKDKIKLIKC